MIGQLLCWREQIDLSLLMFKKAEDVFYFVLQANGDDTVSSLPNTQFCYDFRHHLLN